jgi:hypothetical protein
MPLSPVDKADRNSRSRGILMALGAVVMLVLAAFSAMDVPHGTSDAARGGVWALMILLWLIMLATGGGLLLNRQVRGLMNDEVWLANRGHAIEAGFWAAMAMALALYLANFFRPIPLRDALGMLTEIALAAALFRYAWLELR